MSGTAERAGTLASVLAREAHVLAKDPTHAVEHLHNCLVREPGEGPTPTLLAEARTALRERAWLRLVSASRRPSARAADTVRTLDHAAPVRSVAWSPDGSRVASSGDDGTIRVWDPTSGRTLATLQAAGSVASLSWSPWHRRLASGDTEGYARLWDPDTWTCVEAFAHEERWISSVAWQPGGPLLAVGTGHRCVLWAPGIASDPVGEVPTESILDLSWSPDGRLLANARFDATVWIWDLAAGRLERMCVEPDPVHATAWAPDGRTIATAAGEGGVVTLWDAEGRTRDGTLDGHRSWVWTLGWSPDARVLASGSGSDDRSVGLWDASARTSLGARQGHADAVFAVAWSPSASAVASGSGDGTVVLWDATAGARSGAPAAPEAPEGHADEIEVAAWSADGTALATGADDGLRLWGTDGGATRASPVAGWVRALAWDPDGARVAVSRLQHPSVRVVDALDGSVVGIWPGEPGTAYVLAWHPREAVVAIGGDDGTCTVWDIERDTTRTLEPVTAGVVSSIAWILGGAALAIGHPDGRVELVDLSGAEIADLHGHRGCIRALRWSEAAEALASAADDGEIRVWRARAGWAATILEGHEVLPDPRTYGSVHGPRAIDWSPDGHQIVSGGQDATVRLWDPDTGGQRTIARTLAPVLAVRFLGVEREVVVADDGTHAGNVPVRYAFAIETPAEDA